MQKPLANTLTQAEFDALKKTAQDNFDSSCGISVEVGPFSRRTSLTPFYAERKALLTAYVGYRLGFDNQTEAIVSAAKEALKAQCGSQQFSLLVKDVFRIADGAIAAKFGAGMAV